ncbi:16S rRNA (cytidine(1402)-2'-O)-methyltransferase [Spiroplasma endosymbiont of 'Nebria riversi']|uniref:16S rRNA (cytidine(1402)-2'-O)-methyltransferase n=1 Tax=Spiroplasma endosymbiont of 'Nebria riversi' TaxID=2792084 RepID=UPI001C05C81C|nr:16S rRNA (cytidine(1402)-2'-O)-methyltransferase [Spiroplasma endosymbiont of 'Nebria riversi']
MIQKSFRNEQSSLYLVATPIGNLKELNSRIAETLQLVVVIFCEDTRVSKKILQHFNIKKKLISLHQHNEKERIDLVLQFLNNNQSVALLSDAGYPLISDPGYQLVQAVIAKEYNVVSISGSSALLNALVCSGLPPYPFSFWGFLDRKVEKLKQQVEQLKYRSESLIFYVGVYHLEKTLRAMKEILGNRDVCLARELTKMYETIYRMPLNDIINLDLTSLKGEFVLIVKGYEVVVDYRSLTIKDHIILVAKKQNITIKQAIKEVANMRNLPKSLVYQVYHQE